MDNDSKPYTRARFTIDTIRNVSILLIILAILGGVAILFLNTYYIYKECRIWK
jgi:hypothetical protein